MAPSGNPVEEVILQDIETALAAIIEGSGYYHSVLYVDRVRAGSGKLKGYPSLILIPEGTRINRPGLTQTIEATMVLTITGFIRERTNPALEIQRLVRDVHMALIQDIQRSGNAQITRITEILPFYPVEDTEAIGGFDMTVEVDYRTRELDLNVAT